MAYGWRVNIIDVQGRERFGDYLMCSLLKLLHRRCSGPVTRIWLLARAPIVGVMLG